MSTVSRLLLLIVALAVSAHLARAQNPPKKPPQPLSRPELRACILREDGLKSRGEAMRLAHDEQLASSAELSDEAKALADLHRVIDDSNEAAVSAYNTKNDARNQKVQLHNQRAEALNQAASQLKSDEADFLVSCVARPFLIGDRKAILKELGRPQEERVQKPMPRERPRLPNGTDA